MKTPYILLLALTTLVATEDARGQKTRSAARVKNTDSVQYGVASFYADKFEGRKTANGETFTQRGMTAAHNGLPLGTWIRVTNLRNGRQVVVKVNDRLHHNNPRLLDLTKTAATRLGYVKSGLTKVRLEVLGRKKPSEADKKRVSKAP
jgi:rare lipoprotein A